MTDDRGPLRPLIDELREAVASMRAERIAAERDLALRIARAAEPRHSPTSARRSPCRRGAQP